MPDRVVYLVEEVTAAHKEAVLEFVDAEGLGELIAKGYETSTTLENQKVKVGGKPIKATMMILKQAAENRGVSVLDRHQERGDSGGQMISAEDGFGGTRQVSVAQAMVEATRALARATEDQGRHVGHLGAPSRVKIPGLTVISGEIISQAFDMGMLAGARGETQSACPFPLGSEAATKWLQGHKKGMERHSTMPAAMEIARATEEGYNMAMSVDKDAVVHCPYAGSHPMLKQAWMNGFKSGGGTVE